MRPLCLHPASVLLFHACIVATTAGCERRDQEVPRDSTTVAAVALRDSTIIPAPRTGWNENAGLALLVQGETQNEAIILLPSETDTTVVLRLGNAPAVLLGRGGAQFTAILGPRAMGTEAECRVWLLRDVQSDNGATSWAVGFLGGNVTPIAMDSVDVLSPRDSLALAAEASRLASTVTVESAPSFQGLRFTAQDIRRFEVSSGVQAIVSHVTRKVNQEANPQEEHTLLLAERESGSTTNPYQLAYVERTHGLEEQGVTPEVIAGVRIAGRPTLIIAHDGDLGVTYTLLERTGERQWRVRWRSAGTRCA